MKATANANLQFAIKRREALQETEKNLPTA